MSFQQKVQTVRDYYETATGLLKTALDLDEKGTPLDAYSYYVESLKVINHALSMQLSDQELLQNKEVIIRLEKYKLDFSQRISEIYQIKRQKEEEKEKKFSAQPTSWFGSFFSKDSGPQPSQVQQLYSSQHYHGILTPSPGEKSPIVKKDDSNGKTSNLTQSFHQMNIKSDQKEKPKTLDWKQVPELKNLDEKLLNSILNEVMETGAKVTFEDIKGNDIAKQTIMETVILPSLRPDIFFGIRAPARGVLLYGPPGNGKTMLAKAISTECQTTFFNISASSLVSKWQGEGEKLVRALFAAARYLQPSIIFIDEVDSILGARGKDEQDSMRRLKTEFLVQMDGVGSGGAERVLLLASTNRPHDLDEAVLRRFAKKIFIPLPEKEARVGIVKSLLKEQSTKISSKEWDAIGEYTEKYSASDLNGLCKEMALLPTRELGNKILHVRKEDMRPIMYQDFCTAVKSIKPSVSEEALHDLKAWTAKFGQS